MTFSFNGMSFSAADMKPLRTGNPSIPWVFLSHDRRHVVVVTRDGEGLAAHRATTAEIISLARRCGLPTLLEAFPSSGGAVEMVGGFDPSPGRVSRDNGGGYAIHHV